MQRQEHRETDGRRGRGRGAGRPGLGEPGAWRREPSSGALGGTGPHALLTDSGLQNWKKIKTEFPLEAARMAATWWRCPRNLLWLSGWWSPGRPWASRHENIARIRSDGRKREKADFFSNQEISFLKARVGRSQAPAGGKSFLVPEACVCGGPVPFPRRTLGKAGKRPGRSLPRGGHTRARSSEECFCPE